MIQLAPWIVGVDYIKYLFEVLFQYIPNNIISQGNRASSTSKIQVEVKLLTRERVAHMLSHHVNQHFFFSFVAFFQASQYTKCVEMGDR